MRPELYRVHSLRVCVCPSREQITNPWLTDYVVGTTYQISWTVGDDRPVSLTISNSTWSVDLICEFEDSLTSDFGH
jgi:hypothetical protein